MRKLINLSLAFVFAVDYALIAVAFQQVLGHLDYGWSDDGWLSSMAISGFVCGCVALWFERWLYTRRAFWPAAPLPFLCRSVVPLCLHLP
jgi:hypothetical protein